MKRREENPNKRTKRVSRGTLAQKPQNPPTPVFFRSRNATVHARLGREPARAAAGRRGQPIQHAATAATTRHGSSAEPSQSVTYGTARERRLRATPPPGWESVLLGRSWRPQNRFTPNKKKNKGKNKNKQTTKDTTVCENE